MPENRILFAKILELAIENSACNIISTCLVLSESMHTWGSA